MKKTVATIVMCLGIACVQAQTQPEKYVENLNYLLSKSGIRAVDTVLNQIRQDRNNFFEMTPSEVDYDEIAYKFLDKDVAPLLLNLFVALKNACVKLEQQNKQYLKRSFMDKIRRKPKVHIAGITGAFFWNSSSQLEDALGENNARFNDLKEYFSQDFGTFDLDLEKAAPVDAKDMTSYFGMLKNKVVQSPTVQSIMYVLSQIDRDRGRYLDVENIRGVQTYKHSEVAQPLLGLFEDIQTTIEKQLSRPEKGYSKDQLAKTVSLFHETIHDQLFAMQTEFSDEQCEQLDKIHDFCIENEEKLK